MSAVWAHPANELCKPDAATAVARALGLITGTGDYLFLWRDGSGVIEAKSATGSLTPAQRDFRDWCADRGVRWAKIRTADQGEVTLREWGVLA